MSTTEDLSPLDTVAEVAEKAASEATFESLMGKPRRSMWFPVTTESIDGDEVSLRMKFVAIPPKAYDRLAEKHPPTSKDKAAGATYNIDTFAPALISACSSIPPLTVAQATEIYCSANWSGGEVGNLFLNAARVCNAGLDVSFSARD